MADEERTGSTEIHVSVNTEIEVYPALGISEIGNPAPDQGFRIPAELYRTLNAAYEAVDAAEEAIMRHIAERYPDACDVHYWLKGR